MEKNIKNKHMTFQDRVEIQECLCKSMTFKAIGKRIGKDQTTVSKEIRLHAQSYRNGFVKTDDICPKLLKAPYVCNGCEMKGRSSCKFIRRVYQAKKAQADYETLLSEARTGIPLNKEIFYETEKIISNAVRKGQHVFHAIKSNNLPVSPATVYRHISKGYYTISSIDLPRAVKFKQRKSKQQDYVPTAAKKGRTYDDYLSYVENNPDIPCVELDTVIGRIGGKLILTIHFVNVGFMAGILLNDKTAAEAAHRISELKAKLKKHGFKFGDVFPLLLTDNGGEFSCVSAFENDENGNLESHMFFCNPNAPYQKPHIEKNHTLFRDIVPKGSSFDDFTQETVNLIFSHVNAVKRKQFNGKSAYDLFTYFYSKELADVLGISHIPADEVVQSPSLLK